MTSPTPEERASEAFTEAAAEAVQTSVMAVRLIMSIADVVRRHQQRQKGGAEEDLPSAEESVGEASGEVKKLLPPAGNFVLADAGPHGTAYPPGGARHPPGPATLPW